MDVMRSGACVGALALGHLLGLFLTGCFGKLFEAGRFKYDGGLAY